MSRFADWVRNAPRHITNTTVPEAILRQAAQQAEVEIIVTEARDYRGNRLNGYVAIYSQERDLTAFWKAVEDLTK